jgi:hypothetical protein
MKIRTDRRRRSGIEDWDDFQRDISWASGNRSTRAWPKDGKMIHDTLTVAGVGGTAPGALERAPVALAVKYEIDLFRLFVALSPNPGESCQNASHVHQPPPPHDHRFLFSPSAVLPWFSSRCIFSRLSPAAKVRRRSIPTAEKPTESGKFSRQWEECGD